MSRKPLTPRRRYVRFTRWRRAHFFRVLEETGHAQMAAAAAGVSLGCIYRLRRVEPGFTAKMAAAVAEADRALLQAREESPAAQEGGQAAVTVTGDSRQQALVIRRGRGGRLRVMAAGKHWWTERHDGAFFEHLGATGNVAASARAAGFTPKTAWNRCERLPRFARALEQVREEADLALEYRLMGRGSGRTGDDFGAEAEAPLDPDQAQRTLTFRLNRKLGKHKPPRRRPPPTIKAVTERIERLASVIKRQRENRAKRSGGAPGGSSE